VSQDRMLRRNGNKSIQRKSHSLPFPKAPYFISYPVAFGLVDFFPEEDMKARCHRLPLLEEILEFL
jgi:hypothetical protein